MRKLRCRSAACAVPALERRRRRRRARPRSARVRARRASQHAGHPTDRPNRLDAAIVSRRRARCRSRARLAQARELVVGDAELVAQHLVGVLARASAPGRSSSARGPADMRIGHVGYSCAPTSGCVDRLEEPARPHLRVVERRVRRAPSPPPAMPPRAQLARPRRRRSRVAHHAARSSARHRIAVAVDGDPVVVARAVGTRRRRRAGRATCRRSRSGSPARPSPRSRPRPAAPRRAGPRRCARGARARRRVASAACVPTIGSTRPPGMIGGPPS